MKFVKNRLVLNIIVALIVAVLLSLLFFFGFFYTWQVALSDVLYYDRAPLDNIIIVAIDDKSLQELGRWPWGREKFVELLPLIENASIVGIDIGFFEEYDKKVDESLAEVIRKNGNVVLQVEYSNFVEKEKEPFAKDVLRPIPVLFNSTDNFGYINVLTDKDGVTRSILLDINSQEKYRSFSEEIYLKYLGRELRYENQRLWINFVGGPNTFEYVSFVDIVNEDVNLDKFEEKIVLIGATSPGLQDTFIVPTSRGEKMPGVEIHANAIQTMITQNFIKHQQTFSVIFVIFLISIIVSITLYYFRLIYSTLISISLIILYIALVFTLFNKGIILNIVYPVLTIFLVYGAIVASYYVIEEKNKRWVIDAFGKYISKDLLDEIVNHKRELKLGGGKRTITVFFSDIRGFTSISESLSPEDLVHLLNEYLTEMTDIILAHKGTVDKFIGDAVMAFWNAPLLEKDHAKLACKSAIAQVKRLKELQKEWKKQKREIFEIGCGIHTGEAVIGNMGSEDRFDYTAMGDTINLGSRIEGLTKQYGVSIIISESTYEMVKNDFNCRLLDVVNVKGKKIPIKIYELVVDYDKKFCEQYEKALSLYFKSKFKEALKEFEEALKMKKEDESSKLFVERCKQYLKNPPGKDWNGSFKMKTK